ARSRSATECRRQPTRNFNRSPTWSPSPHRPLTSPGARCSTRSSRREAGRMTGPKPVSIGDMRLRAETAVPPDVWDFVEGGSGAELTLANNQAALEAVALVPRVLAGVSTSDTSGQLLGRPVAMPVAVAPMAYQRLLHPDGELAAARAARDAGVPFVLST